MDLPTLRDDDLVLRPKCPHNRDSGELRACPRGDPDQKVYAVYVTNA